MAKKEEMTEEEYYAASGAAHYAGIEAISSPVTSITEHGGRWWWAWYDERAHQWTAPTPELGGRYVGSKGYVCSGAAVSRDSREGLVSHLEELGYEVETEKN